MTGLAGFTHGPAPMQPASASVRNWLIVVAAMIFLMIVLGALTRLTESGLSMVEWRPVTGWLPPLSDDSVAGGAAEISFVAAGPIGESWFQRGRIQTDLLAGVPASPVGSADRRRRRAAARLVLAARAAVARPQAAAGGPAGAGRPARRAGLGDGGVGPGRPALGQPLPAGRPSAAGGGALRLHGLAGARARRRRRAATIRKTPARSDRADRLPVRRADLRRADGGPARRHRAQHLPHHVGLLDPARHVRSVAMVDQSVRERHDHAVHPSLARQAAGAGRDRAGDRARAGPRRWPPAPWRWCSSASESPRS